MVISPRKMPQLIIWNKILIVGRKTFADEDPSGAVVMSNMLGHSIVVIKLTMKN